jgi:hypothetical protein
VRGVWTGVFATGRSPRHGWGLGVLGRIVFFPLTFRIVLCIVFILIQNMEYIIQGGCDGKRRRDL